MKDFIDRVPTYKGRKIIKYEDGTEEIVTIENADEPTVDGTFINRDNLMAIQGFIGMTTEKLENGSILQTSADGDTLLTSKKNDGSIEQIFTGFSSKKSIIKTTFKQDGKILEVIS